MLNWTERIIRMRKEVPEIGWGDFKVIATRDPAVLIIRYDWRNNSVLFVHNLDEKPREISFSVGLPGDAGKLLVNLLAEDHSRANERGQHQLLLEAYGYRWYRVGGLDYLLKRSDIDHSRRGRPRRLAPRSPAACRAIEPTFYRADDHAFIAAQIERAFTLSRLPGPGRSKQDFAGEPRGIRGDRNRLDRQGSAR